MLVLVIARRRADFEVPGVNFGYILGLVLNNVFQRIHTRPLTLNKSTSDVSNQLMVFYIKTVYVMLFRDQMFSVKYSIEMTDHDYVNWNFESQYA